MKKLVSLFSGKIRVKLFAIIFAIVVSLLILVSFISYNVLFRSFTASTYRKLCAAADTIDLLIPDEGTYYYDLYSLSENQNVDFEITDRDGYLLYTTKGSGSALSSSHFAASGSTTSEYPDMLASSKYKKDFGYPNFEIKKKAATNADYFVYHTELFSGDMLYIYSPVADVEDIVSVADKVYSVFSLVMVALMGAAFFFISTSFTKPVEAMNDVTKDMAALNFGRKCDNYGKDEIGELGRNINILSDTLDSTLMDLKDKNEQLEKDIELRLALDNARKSFISNVSHELKTPIAIISGYAEGLYEGISDDPQVIREYCGIINEESKKMNDLVLELLELSKLESKTAPFTPDYFDIGECVTSIVNHLSLKTGENGITVLNNISPDLECYAQGDKIEIVLKNYITNAISHCGGEKRITIDSEDLGKSLRITVFNTGDNISEEDLPEIWDSFYRADKAHGRSESRFGLGLSIVKSIMINHGCSYGVENTGDGVKFSFEVAKDSDYYEA